MSEGEPFRILLIEDDKDIRESVRDLLELEGYSIQEAKNGQEALTRLATGPVPGLLILDMLMPVMNGWDFMNQWAQDRVPPIPVIGMSATLNRAMPMGLERVLRKPVELDELLGAVTEVARRPR